MIATRTLLFVLLAFVSCGNAPPSKDVGSFTLHSKIVNDDYTISIKKPEAFYNDSSYHLLVIADGTIGLGDYVLGRDASWKAEHPSNCIIVTIGHNGDWHKKRRRDFIPSDAGGYKDENFGRADNFYLFLKTELLPVLAKKLPKCKSKSFIGHSFSGLFSLYAALKNDHSFDSYYAISPSVWANDEELIKILNNLQTERLPTSIHLYVGGLEVFNKVLSSSKKFYRKITARNLDSLSITFDVISWSNHFSVRKPAIDKIFKSFSNAE